MDRLKILYILLGCTVLLSLVFGILILIQDSEANYIGGTGAWCGVISQLLLSAALMIEIARIKKGRDN